MPSDYTPKENAGGDKAIYPYIVSTESATWYLAKDDISLFDGRMEMILIRQPDNPADNPKMLGAVLMQDTSSEFIVFAHTKRVHFEAEKPILWTIDGENGGEVQKGDIVLCRNAIEMFV